MTNAITPNLPAHDPLAPLASRLVDPATLQWQATRYPGIEVKTLLFDRNSGLAAALMRMAPAAVLPDHEHVQIEQTWVEGHLVDGEGPDFLTRMAVPKTWAARTGRRFGARCKLIGA